MIKALDDTRQTELKRVLKETHGNVRASAVLLGVSRETIHRWCRKFGVNTDDYRGARSTWAVYLRGHYVMHTDAPTEADAISVAVKRLQLSSPQDLSALTAKQET